MKYLAGLLLFVLCFGGYLVFVDSPALQELQESEPESTQAATLPGGSLGGTQRSTSETPSQGITQEVNHAKEQADLSGDNHSDALPSSTSDESNEKPSAILAKTGKEAWRNYANQVRAAMAAKPSNEWPTLSDTTLRGTHSGRCVSFMDIGGKPFSDVLRHFGTTYKDHRNEEKLREARPSSLRVDPAKGVKIGVTWPICDAGNPDWALTFTALPKGGSYTVYHPEAESAIPAKFEGGYFLPFVRPVAVIATLTSHSGVTFSMIQFKRGSRYVFDFPRALSGQKKTARAHSLRITSQQGRYLEHALVFRGSIPGDSRLIEAVSDASGLAMLKLHQDSWEPEKFAVFHPSWLPEEARIGPKVNTTETTISLVKPAHWLAFETDIEVFRYSGAGNTDFSDARFSAFKRVLPRARPQITELLDGVCHVGLASHEWVEKSYSFSRSKWVEVEASRPTWNEQRELLIPRVLQRMEGLAQWPDRQRSLYRNEGFQRLLMEHSDARPDFSFPTKDLTSLSFRSGSSLILMPFEGPWIVDLRNVSMFHPTDGTLIPLVPRYFQLDADYSTGRATLKEIFEDDVIDEHE